MRVGFQRDVRSSPARGFSRLFERDRLRVFEFVVYVEAFADDLLSIVDDHTTDQRSRAHEANAARRQLKRLPHHAMVKVGRFNSCFRSQAPRLCPVRRSFAKQQCDWVHTKGRSPP